MKKRDILDEIISTMNAMVEVEKQEAVKAFLALDRDEGIKRSIRMSALAQATGRIEAMVEARLNQEKQSR